MTAVDLEKLKSIISRGLSSGLGQAEGQVCVEGAIALASGEGLTDTPSCVAREDRAYAVRINDAPWSSPKARAEALLPLALAQIGTAGTDRSEWVKRLVEGTIRRVLPIALRHEANLVGDATYASTAAAADAAAAYAAYAASDAADASYASYASYAAYASAAAAYAYAAYAAADADAAAYAASAADAAAYAASTAAYAASDAAAGERCLRESIAVALDAYRAEGRGQ